MNLVFYLLEVSKKKKEFCRPKMKFGSWLLIKCYHLKKKKAMVFYNIALI